MYFIDLIRTALAWPAIHGTCARRHRTSLSVGGAIPGAAANQDRQLQWFDDDCVDVGC